MWKFERRAIEDAIERGWLLECGDPDFPDWEIKAGYERHIGQLIQDEWKTAAEIEKDEFIVLILEQYSDHLMAGRITWEQAILCRLEQIIFMEQIA